MSVPFFQILVETTTDDDLFVLEEWATQQGVPGSAPSPRVLALPDGFVVQTPGAEQCEDLARHTSLSEPLLASFRHALDMGRAYCLIQTPTPDNPLQPGEPCPRCGKPLHESGRCKDTACATQMWRTLFEDDPSARPIDDADICHRCRRLFYSPGSYSRCQLADPDWPAWLGPDGRAQSCTHVLPVANPRDNRLIPSETQDTPTREGLRP